MDESIPVIAIDGPSASGKGTVAQQVAAALGFHYLDSGALYRLVTLAALHKGVFLDDEARLAQTTRGMRGDFRNRRTFLEGVDLTPERGTETGSAAPPRVAANPAGRPTPPPPPGGV